MAENFRVTLFPERIAQIVNNPSGGASRLVERTCRSIVEKAKPLIGTRYSGHHAGRGRQLSNSGKVQHNRGASWSAVFEHPIAVIHHEGASPHTMPKKIGGFYYRNGPGVVTSKGDTVFGPRRGPISHPGHKGNPYLTTAAKEVARAAGALRRGTAGPFPVFRVRS